MNGRKALTATLSLAVSIGMLQSVAVAGGGSPDAISSAIRSGSEDAIVAQLEKAEDIACSSVCMEMVMGLLDHDSYYVREAAAWWFARRPAQKSELAELATSWLTTGTSTEARNGADILGTFGYATYMPVLEAAATRAAFSAQARAHAVRALGRISNRSANDTVALAMQDDAAEVRFEAVEAWRNMLLQTEAAPVAALVGDSDREVRRSAIAVVGKFREASARSGLETQLLESPDAPTRRNAAWALGADRRRGVPGRPDYRQQGRVASGSNDGGQRSPPASLGQRELKTDIRGGTRAGTRRVTLQLASRPIFFGRIGQGAENSLNAVNSRGPWAV